MNLSLLVKSTNYKAEMNQYIGWTLDNRREALDINSVNDFIKEKRYSGDVKKDFTDIVNAYNKRDEFFRNLGSTL